MGEAAPGEVAPGSAEHEVLGNDPVSAASRIRELNDIDSEVTHMLQSAGKAIRTLTGRPPAADDGVEPDLTTLDVAKNAFEFHTTEFYTHIQAITARLRRQVYALEEANIIASEPPSAFDFEPPPPSSATAAPSRLAGAAGVPIKANPPMQITNDGMGKFDVGWLNSRNDKVGEIKESELLVEAKRLLEIDSPAEEATDVIMDDSADSR